MSVYNELDSNGKKGVYTKDIFTRINNDSNGNPRYVFGFLCLTLDSDDEIVPDDIHRISALLRLAVNRARAYPINGKKYRGKDYAGGIVFSSYNVYDELRAINDFKAGITKL